MKYVAPVLLLIGYFALLFLKAGEVYKLEQEQTQIKIVASELVIKQSFLSEKVGEVASFFDAKAIKEDEQIENNLLETPEKRSFTSGPIFYGNVTGEQIVYLTFDDGPSKNTEKILDILKEYEIPATFFVNGNRSEFAKAMYERIVDEGHTIGNHSYSHNYATIYKSKNHFLDDFLKMEQLLIETVGFAPKIIRYPGGSNNTISQRYGGAKIMDEIVYEMEQRGYHHLDWNIDSLDTSKVRQEKDVIINAVINGSKGKNELIVLFHDSQVKETTVEALPIIIEHFIDKGNQFAKVTEDSFYIQFNHTR